MLLFSTNATTLGHDPVFWIKMGLLIIAGLNALAFHRYTLRIVSALDTTASLGVKSKLHAMISMIAWLAIIACGRLLAY